MRRTLKEYKTIHVKANGDIYRSFRGACLAADLPIQDMVTLALADMRDRIRDGYRPKIAKRDKDFETAMQESVDAVRI